MGSRVTVPDGRAGVLVVVGMISMSNCSEVKAVLLCKLTTTGMTAVEPLPANRVDVKPISLTGLPTPLVTTLTLVPLAARRRKKLKSWSELHH